MAKRSPWIVPIAFCTMILVLGSARSADARVLFRGGFEEGHRGPFDRYHAVEASPPRIDVVSKPVADGLNRVGERAARIEVRPGDDARKLDPVTGRKIGDNVYRERAELAVTSPFDPEHSFLREGDDVWLGAQMMFPKNGWQGSDRFGDGTIVLQFHHVDLAADSFNGSPPLMFVADDTRLRVVQCERYLCPSVTDLHEEPLKYDHWYTFVLHIVHSSDPRKGLLEVWIDGEKRVERNTALLFGTNFANYLLAGQYRRPDSPSTSVLFADNFVMATTEAEVLAALGPASIPVESVAEPDEGEHEGVGDGGVGDGEPLEGSEPDPGFLDHEAGGDLRFLQRARAGCQQVGVSAVGAIGLIALLLRRRKRCRVSA